MTYSLSFTIPGLPKLPNELLRRHWSVVSRERKKWHNEVWAATVTEVKPTEPLKRARLTLTRRSSVICDGDNMRASWKFVIDGLVKAGVLLDDNPGVIESIKYQWEYAPPKRGSVEIKVEEIE